MAKTKVASHQVGNIDWLNFTATDIQPSAPPAGEGRLFVDRKLTKAIPMFRGPSDTFRISPHFSDNHLSVAQVSNSATWTWFGAGNVLSTGNAAATRGDTHFTQQHRISYTTAATASAVAHMRNNGAYYHRGASGSGRGGFLWRAKGGVRLFAANMQAFMGLRSNGAAIATGNPSAILTNVLGFGFDSADGTWQFMHNDGSGTCTKVSLGANFPSNTNEADWCQFTIFAFPGDSEIYWHAFNLTDSVEASGSVNTNIPDTTTFLGWQNWCSNGTTAASAGMDFGTLYLESPF